MANPLVEPTRPGALSTYNPVPFSDLAGMSFQSSNPFMTADSGANSSSPWMQGQQTTSYQGQDIPSQLFYTASDASGPGFQATTFNFNPKTGEYVPTTQQGSANQPSAGYGLLGDAITAAGLGITGAGAAGLLGAGDATGGAAALGGSTAGDVAGAGAGLAGAAPAASTGVDLTNSLATDPLTGQVTGTGALNAGIPSGTFQLGGVDQIAGTGLGTDALGAAGAVDAGTTIPGLLSGAGAGGAAGLGDTLSSLLGNKPLVSALTKAIGSAVTGGLSGGNASTGASAGGGGSPGFASVSPGFSGSVGNAAGTAGMQTPGFRGQLAGPVTYQGTDPMYLAQALRSMLNRQS